MATEINKDKLKALQLTMDKHRLRNLTMPGSLDSLIQSYYDTLATQRNWIYSVVDNFQSINSQIRMVTQSVSESCVALPIAAMEHQGTREGLPSLKKSLTPLSLELQDLKKSTKVLRSRKL